MTIMRLKELRELNNEELDDKLEEFNKELIKIRTQISSKQTPDNPGRVKELKKLIARIRTIKHLRGDE